MLATAIMGLSQGGYGWQQAPPAEKPSAPKPLGQQFVTVSSPIDDTVFDNVSRVALTLQAQAERDGREAVLVLEVRPGRSTDFHQAQRLASFLMKQVRKLKTVAWVPETIQGNHTVVVLACDEIVLREGVAVGDIGLTPADVAERTFVLTLGDSGHNPRTNASLILGMLDVEKRLMWAKTAKGPAVLTADEFDRLEAKGEPLENPVVLKEAGVPGMVTSEQARSYGILAAHVLPKDAERHTVRDLYQLHAEAMREAPADQAQQKATIIRVDDVITPLTEQFVKRQIDRAVSGGASLLIFDIDSPEGGLYESMSLADAIEDVSHREVRTVAFVPREARGGSALIALACDEIYMTPKAQLGEIRPSANGGWNTDPEKLRSALRQKLEDLAIKKNRSPALYRAMADSSVIVYTAQRNANGATGYMTAEELAAEEPEWTKGDVLPETDGRQLLKVNGRRAAQLGLAEPTVEDLTDLKRRLGLTSVEVPVAQRTWVDALVFELNKPHVTGMVFVLGLLFAYMEMHFGVGIFGISSGVCFTLFFWSRFLGGTADWLEVSLFLLGLGCLALELFVVPGFGVFGFSGIVLLLFSLVLASQTFIIPASPSELASLTRNFGTLAGSIVGVFVLGMLLSRYLPSMPFFEGMVLNPPGADSQHEPRLNPAYMDGPTSPTLLTRDSSLVGQQGTTTTGLRPAGKALIGDALMDVVSDGPFIPAGKPIEIVSIEGTVVVVRPVEGERA